MNKKEPSIPSARVNKIATLNVEVAIKGRKYLGLVDTGSDLTIIKKSVQKEIGHSECDGTELFLIPFAGGIKRTLGSINTTLEIDNQKYDLRCHVVLDDWMTADGLLGKHMLQQAILVI